MTLETTKAGRGVKIEWKLKEAASGLSLRGYRKTGGFFANQFDEQENGELMAHSNMDGSVVEILPENVATFYTFLLLGKDAEGTERYWSPIRFQITITSQDEMRSIDELLSSVEGGQSNSRGNMSKVIKELDLAMEFHDAMDVMEQSLVAKIKGKKLPPEEQEEKITFVRDMVRLQREKYQP